MMEIVYYITRCKHASGVERHNTVHAATNDNQTVCGKELDEMWFIESPFGKSENDINCRVCKTALQNS